MYEGEEDSHFQNGGVRLPYICPSIKSTTLTKMIRINFFRTLDINQRLTRIPEAFIKKKINK